MPETITTNVSNVTAGKPAVAGAIYRAPLGTELPTDAKTPLSNAFISLGYCGEDGFRNDNNRTVRKIKAWGGQNVLTVQEEVADDFKVNLIEALNVNVLKAIYNDGNVTEANGLVTLNVTTEENAEGVWVCDMVMRGNKLKRVIIPRGQITNMEEIVYVDNDAVGYNVTITATAFEGNKTHREFIEAASA